MGVVTGEMLVDGMVRDYSFQRKTGYVTQQDLHLHTSTVREALTFSALLRQPSTYSSAEKVAYVDTVIDLLEMNEYSDAIIGTLGEGLNVEQRKRLTIGVELASRPALLLFLDEPTSGLDSQTSWSICNLMEKLTKAGQAVLCTIHQPSAILFQRFDRLLLLAKGGKTVYFGEIGKDSQTLVDYFVRNGGPSLPPRANPAEYMLEVIGAAPGAQTDIDWPVVWRASPEYRGVHEELQRLASNPVKPAYGSAVSSADYKEFAATYRLQFREVIKRAFQQYWRSPSYIYSKTFLSIGAVCVMSSFLHETEANKSGAFHWAVVSERRQYPEWAAKPDVRRFYLFDCFQSACRSDHACLCFATGHVRGAGASSKSILLDGIPRCKYTGRAWVEHGKLC
jgi:ABC-type multidrug transport system ATPase subunit